LLCAKKNVSLVVCGLAFQPLDIALRSGLTALLSNRLALDVAQGLILAHTLIESENPAPFSGDR
jgi:hypothetical protein